jgi:hypothetical protein
LKKLKEKSFFRLNRWKMSLTWTWLPSATKYIANAWDCLVVDGLIGWLSK